MIANSSHPTDLVYDPFCGSGQDSLPQRVDHLFRLVLCAGDAGFGDQSANCEHLPRGLETRTKRIVV
jgi:hypothetical protein